MEGADEGQHPPSPAAAEVPAERSAAARDPDKVIILAKNVANAPILALVQLERIHGPAVSQRRLYRLLTLAASELEFLCI